MSGFWRQALAVAGRDLIGELRSGEVLLVTAPFGGVALLLIPMAIGTDRPLLARIGPGMYWVVVLLFGILVALRRSSAETAPQRDLLGLLGIDPAARFTGQGLANAALLALYATALAPVAVALYDPDLSGWWWMALVLPLTVGGVALLATVAGRLVTALDSGPTLVPLLVAPLAVPLLLGATQALEGLRLGESILGWLLLLAAVDLALAVAGVLGARSLEEASR